MTFIVPNLNWQPYGPGGTQAMLVAEVVVGPNVGVTQITPSGTYASLGQVYASGFVVDNTNDLSLNVDPGTLFYTQSARSRRHYRLPPLFPNQINFANSVSGFTVTFYTGPFPPVGEDFSIYDNVYNALLNFGTTALNTGNTAFLVQAKQKATYDVSAVISQAAGGDIFQLRGSNTKTVRITNCKLSGISGAISSAQVALLKRSSAQTGGTTSPIDSGTPLNRYSGNLPPSATATAWSTPGTPGTLIGVWGREYIQIGTTSQAGVPVLDKTPVSDIIEQEWILANNSEYFTIQNTLNTGVYTGTSIDVHVTFTED